MAVAIFGLTYFFIGGRQNRVFPLNRPAAAMLGAVLMVSCGVMTREQAYGAVDYDTIILLLGMMIICAYLKIGGFFEWTAHMILRRASHPHRLLLALILTSGTLSALLVNDTVCLMMTPLVVAVIARARLPLVPYLLALAMSANIGSVATLVGNPQNMIVGSMSQIPFGAFVRSLVPVAAVNLAILYFILRVAFARELECEAVPVREETAPTVDRFLLILSATVLVGVFVGFVCGGNLAWTALTGAAALMVLARRDTHQTLKLVDWNLLLFFAALFVVVAGLNQTGLPAQLHANLKPFWGNNRLSQMATFSALSLAGANLFSNVPYVLIAGHWIAAFSQPAFMWKVLALSTTFAGNFTILGSVANVIVVESARRHVDIGFWQYARIGIPITLITTMVGLAVLTLLS